MKYPLSKRQRKLYDFIRANKARSISLVPDGKEEINDLRAVKAAAASFVQVQENFRQAYDSNPADPKNNTERAPMVAKALDMLKGLIN